MNRDERRDFERDLADALDAGLRRYDGWEDYEPHPAELADPSEWPVGWRVAGGGIVHGMCPVCIQSVPYRQRADGIAAVPHAGLSGLCRGMRIRGLTLGASTLRAPLGERVGVAA